MTGTGDAGDKGAQTRLLRDVATAAVEKLGIRKFITDHLADITRRLEECESAAQDAPLDSDILFVALSLPILNGVIHFASNRESLRNAMSWATNKWRGKKARDFDPIAILSSLTLIYVAFEGSEGNPNSPAWKSIRKHISELGKDLTPPADSG